MNWLKFSPHPFRWLAEILLVAALLTLDAQAQSPMKLERSLTASETLPDLVPPKASSIHWSLNWQTSDGAIPATSTNQSLASSLEGWTLRVAPIDSRAIESLSVAETIAIEATEVGGSATLTEILEPGVYQVQLQPPNTPRKWTDLLPWENPSPDQTPSKQLTWPIVVMPSASQETAERDKSDSYNGDWIVHWNRSPDSFTRPTPIDSEARPSGLSSMLPNPASASKMLNRLPSSWRDGSWRGEGSREASSANSGSPAVTWSVRVEGIRQRLQRIISLNAAGIALPKPRRHDGALPSPIPTRTEQELILQIVEAEANAAGLRVWRWEDALPADTDASGTEPTQAADQRKLVLRWNEQVRSVADFRRAPKTSLQARFAPRLSSANDSDFVWFGTEPIRIEDASTELPESPKVTSALPAPLIDSIDGLTTKTWLEDLAIWLIHWKDSRANNAVGMVIDESLLDETDSSSVAMIEEALAVWQTGWREDSRWLRPSTTSANSVAPTTASGLNSRASDSEPGPATAISTKSLIHVRQVHRNGSTMLVFFNEAPWPVRVTLPLANLVEWNSTVGQGFTLASDLTHSVKWSSFTLTRPSVSMLGSTLIVPANGTMVCQTDQELSRDLTFGYRIDGGSAAIDRLTQDVTKIVEHLGLLGELACLSSYGCSDIASNGSPRSESTVSSAWIHSVSDPQSPSAKKRDESRSGGWAASIWSSDRWGFGRAISNPSGPADAPAVDQHAASEQKISFASTPMVREGTTKHAMASDQLGPDVTGAMESTTNSSKKIVSRYETYRNLIPNGGFESSQEIGIAGWMHSQHPNDAVALDPRTQHSGSKSVRLLGKDERGSTAWLISREIRTPSSGRIGVSMALRGERPPEIKNYEIRTAETTGKLLANNDQSIGRDANDVVVRIAIEGERDGHPIRYATELKVPADGQWKPGRIDLQVLNLDPERDANLRLTIDNLSTSSVWIDDIVVTDYFASQAERSELQSLAYLAVNGLQSSNLTPAARLIRNYWAKELLRVAQQSPVSLLPSSDSVSKTSPAVSEADGFSANRSYGLRPGLLPNPMWEVATQEIPSGSQATLKQSQPEVPSNRSSPQEPGSFDPTESGPKASENRPENSDATVTDDERPVSLSRRIRSWIPAPLRF